MIKLNRTLVVSGVAGVLFAFAGYLAAANVNSAQTGRYDLSEFGVSVVYPSDYMVFQERGGFVQVANRNFIGFEGEYPSIMITVRSNPANFSPADWLKERSELLCWSADIRGGLELWGPKFGGGR